MVEICPKCGLPKDLCICDKIAKEQQRIKVFVEKRRYGKAVTIVKGIDPKDVDVKKLIKFLKSKLACGGTFKNDEIELQGDHRDKVKPLLVKQGFSEEIIEVK
ncbi:MAG: stress response translation initiation inhibitor YciH [Candidatus Aenigmarchaeota archaeon]|nr:stress response translation initiation inhibitor YciH [Candidatus Aenigmarchaeota archaeon]